MITEHYDGHPIQAGSRGGQLSGHFAEFSIAGFSECLVVARRYVDQDGNRQRTSVEYDVRDMNTGAKITNVRALQRSFGMQNGEEIVYHPASKALPDNVQLSMRTIAQDTDGDLVVVGFLGGSRGQAVIFGQLPHGNVAYAAKAADGERRFLVHNGTTVQIKADGSLEIARRDTLVTIAEDGVVTIKAPRTVIGSDPDDVTNASGIGDAVHTPLLSLVAKLQPFFVPSGAPPPSPTEFVEGSIATGSSSVLVTKG